MKHGILYDIISKSGLQQNDVAEKIGVSPQLFNYMIRKPKNLKADQIKAIAEALGRSPRNLFSIIINN